MADQSIGQSETVQKPSADEIADSESPSEPLAKIQADIVSTFSFAAYQNSFPVIRGLTVTNQSESTQYDLVLQLAASPSFVRNKQWHIDRLLPKESLPIRDLDLEVDSDFLRGLNEAERGELRFKLRDNIQPLATATHDLRVLARDEWGGFGSAGELLAAFVTPNDPAIARLLKNASQILTDNGHLGSLEGYQSGQPQRAYLQIAAAWSALTAEGLTYANPPRSFEEQGQKTRSPETIINQRLATCLDSTLLFAGMIEALGLNPVIIMRQGHCFVGGWLRDTRFPSVINSDPSEVRKAIQAHELVVFETTLVTHLPPGRFEQAIREANAQLAEDEEFAFVAALDISRARMAGIKPLASHGSTRVTDQPVDAIAVGPVPLAVPPEFEDLPDDISEQIPTTADGRIERWQRKLLDLSLRNRLLNFKDTKQTIPIYCPDIAALEDHLACGKSVKLVSTEQLDAVDGRDNQLYRSRAGEDVLQEFVLSAWSSREVVAPLNERELSARLTTVYRAARSDMAEGGSNTLYLAVGFLRWKQNPTDPKSYRAPLLLIPVKLTRQSAVSPYKISLHEDEVRFNATLIQLLKKDFALDLTEFETCLPRDQDGVNVQKVLQRVRQLVRDAAGFEVVSEVALGTFSFVKYLLWKDLVDRLNELEKNPVVRHLIREPEKVYRESDRALMPASRQIDVAFQPHELLHPLPADSSQLAAVMAAARGHDFVLIGPPGTGKSQTIANMIAQCLAEKKTVLFVAEKTAALDVVYRRLCEHNLGNSCLELHSNKSERKQFLEQLKKAWKAQSPPTDRQWQTTSAQLKSKRDQLNRYVAELHKPAPSGWTIFQAMGRIVRDADLDSPVLGWPARPDVGQLNVGHLEHDHHSYQQLLDATRDLTVTFAAIQPSSSLQAVDQAEWSVRWEQDLLDQSEKFASATSQMSQHAQSLLEALDMNLSQIQSIDDVRAIVHFANAIVQAESTNCRLVFDKQFAKLGGEVARAGSEIQEYRQAREKLSGQYDDATVPDIPLKQLENQWREAISVLWPFSFLAKRKVRKLLSTYSTGGKVDVEQDLPQLLILQKRLSSLSKNLLNGKVDLWQGPQTDVEGLQRHLKIIEQTRKAIMTLGQRFGNLESVSRKLAPVLIDTSGQHAISKLVKDYLAKATAWLTSVDDMQQVCCSDFVEKMPRRTDLFATLEAIANGLQKERTKLRSWTAWCAVRRRARNLALDGCVQSLESGQIDPEDLVERFELAYARWWLPLAIDRCDLLRSFQGFQHEDAIREFRKLDDEARRLASLTVSHAAGHGFPPEDGVPQRSELGLLRHQMNLQRPSKAIREVIAGMPNTFSKLAPCVLMSPLSIAQYLPADHPPFDVVIFDEASQITTWDAIGAIARGRQTIVVGDPKQLPPTNFFGRNDNSDSDDLEEIHQDLESILDETKAAGLPVLDLKWHYRSRHESLIAFSNQKYYNDELITFPSADLLDCGVQFRHVPGAIYDRGTSRTNKAEAEAIVAEAVKRMEDWLRMPEEDRLTLAVVTFNQTQQSLIQDLFDQAMRDNPDLEWYFSDDRIEPTVVKNLENVQGDERDVIIFSVTYGFDSAGSFYRNFGALNSAGGERRLNVAVTRARQLLLVFASFTADQLDVNGLNSRGVIDLKHFLHFAEKGDAALRPQPDGQQGDHDSPFEEAVAEALQSLGWRVIPQVGVSKFRIDLGIVHPHRPGSFLAGIECDGATYHRSATARDRDKIREQVLRNLGWEMIRIWSPDWWYDKKGALQKVDSQLRQLLEDSITTPDPESPSDESSNVENPIAKPPAESTLTQQSQPGSSTSDYLTHSDESMSHVSAPKVEYQVESGRSDFADVDSLTSELEDGSRYQVYDFSDWETEPEAFHQPQYENKLSKMIGQLIQLEQPIHEERITQRIARAHGWTRTGRRIKQRVLELLTPFAVMPESTGNFYWGEAGPQETTPFRSPTRDEDRRPLEHISIAEIRGAVQENKAILFSEDPDLELGRALGYSRITVAMRNRLSEAITQAQAAAKA
jgi:very-short-patch-repair endonuclease